MRILLLLLIAWALFGCVDGEKTADKPAVTGAEQAEAPADYTRQQPQAQAAPTRSRAQVPEGDHRLLTWQDLADVQFEEKYYEDVQEYLWYPSFGEKVKAAEGKPVYIAGYVIPVEAGRYVLSKNTFASCFFCGGAGPETVMELELTDPEVLFANDEFRTFKGTFATNDSNIDKLNYILEEATVVED